MKSLKANNGEEELKNKQKICDYLDRYTFKEMNQIEQKIFRGIIEKKVSDNDAFIESDENNQNEDLSSNKLKIGNA